MSTSGPLGYLYNILEWMTRFLFVNLLWLIFSIPVVYFAITLLVTQNTEQFLATTIILIVLTPLFLFPATAAMFAIIRKWIMKEWDIPIVKYYWKFYKENYVQSMFGGLIISGIWVIFIFNYYYYTESESGLFYYLFILIFVMLIMFTVHFISTIVHLETKVVYALKNALLLTVGRPIFGVGLGILNVLIIYISFYHITFLIPFFMGTFIALVSFSGYYKIYVSIESLREQNMDS